jgi:phage-related protein
MAVTEDMLIKIQVDTSEAVKALSLISSTIAEVNQSVASVEKSSAKSSKALTGFGAAAVKMNQALELAQKGIRLLVGPVLGMVKDFQASQDGVTRLGKTLQIMGSRDVNGTVKHFQDLADQLEQNTTVDGDLVLSLAKMGTSLELTTAQIDQMIETAIDMAATTGGSVDSAFQALVGTLKGNGKAVGDLSILLQGLTKEELEAGKGVDVLSEKLKGMGKGEAETFAGRMIQAFKELGNIGKDIGKILSIGLNIESSGNVLLSTLKLIREGIEQIRTPAQTTLVYIRATINGLIEAFKAIDFSALLVQIENLFKFSLKLGAAIAGLALAMNAQAFGAFLVTLGSTAAAMVKLGIATVASTANFALMAVSVFTVVTALDVLIANVKNLPKTLATGLTVVRTGFVGLGETLARSVGFNKAADKLKSEADALAASAVESGKDLDPGVILEGLNQATAALGGFKKGFNETTDAASGTMKSVEQFSNATNDVPKKIKGMTEEGKKLVQELADSLIKLNKELSEVGASEGQKIAINNAERIRELGLLEQKLAKERALRPIQIEQLKKAVEVSNAIAAKQASEIKKKNLTEEINKTKELANQIMDMNATTMDRIQMEKQAGLDAIAKRREELALDKEINKEALAQLDSQEALLEMKSKMAAERAPNADFEAAQMAGGNLGASVAQAFQGPISGMLAGAGAFADAIQGLIDFIPQMLDKISGIFLSLTELPLKIIEGFSKLSDAILGLVEKFIPRVFEMLAKLPEILISFFDKLPEVFGNLFAKLPDMILGLAEKFPELVEKLISAIIPALPRIAIDLAKALITKGPQIAIALAKAMAIEVPKAIVMGLINGIKEALGALRDAFKKPFKEAAKALVPDPKALALGMRQAAKTLTGEASKLFAVMDLTDAAKGAETAKDLGKKVTDAGKDALDKLDKTGADFFKGLKAAWQWVMDHIIQPMIDGILMVWRMVYENIIKPFFTVLQTIWNGLMEVLKSVWNGLMVVLKAAWDVVMVVFKAVINYLKAIWDVVLIAFDAVIKVLKSVWDTVLVAFQAVIDVFQAVWGAMMSIFQSLWGTIQTIWQTLMDLFAGKISILDAVFKIGGAIFDHVVEAFQAVWNVAQTIFNSITSVFSSVFNTAKVYLEGVANVFSGVFNVAKVAFDGILSVFGAVVDAFQRLVGVYLEIGGKIFDGLKNAFSAAGNFFADIGGKIWEGLKNGLSGLKDLLAGAFNALNPIAIFEKIFKVDTGAFGNKGTVEKALGIDLPFMSFASGGMVPGQSITDGDSKMNDKILALLSPGEAIIPKSAMKDPVIAKLINQIIKGELPGYGFGGYAKQVVDKGRATIADPVGAAAQTASDTVGVVVDGVKDLVDPAKLWESVFGKVSEAIMEIFKSNKFHEGGEVPAMLKPGEYVINRQAAQSIGTPTLDAINRGQSTGSQTINQTVTLNITTTQPIDENFIRNKIYPVVKEQIKRASADGQTVVYASGVRNV